MHTRDRNGLGVVGLVCMLVLAAAPVAWRNVSRFLISRPGGRYTRLYDRKIWVLAGSLILALGACTTTSDPLARNVPKGYVEFYQTRYGKSPFWVVGRAWGPVNVNLYELESGKKRHVGYIGFPDKKAKHKFFEPSMTLRRKVAVSPGKHVFMVDARFDTGQEALKAAKAGVKPQEVEVDVQEGMVTPVEIAISEEGKRVEPDPFTYFFGFSLKPGAPHK